MMAAQSEHVIKIGSIEVTPFQLLRYVLAGISVLIGIIAMAQN